MKKSLSVFLMILMLCSLFGCGKQNNSSKKDVSPVSDSTTEASQYQDPNDLKAVCMTYELIKNQYPKFKEKGYIISPPFECNTFDELSQNATTLYYICGDKETAISTSDVNKFIFDTFGFSDFIIKDRVFPDKAIVIANFTGYFNFSYPSSIKSIKSLGNSKTEVVLDYYSDGSDEKIAKTVKYVLNGVPYKHCIIESRTVIFDSGESIAVGLI